MRMTDHQELLDLDTLRELREMLGAGLAPVLTQFGAQAQELLAGMEQQARSGDLPAVRTLAHKLKGSAGSVGARALAAEAAQLEKSAAAGDLVGVRAQLEQMSPLAVRTVQALHA
jgi:HPt (histidine-containing phosphotransfer) domain-containing protein